MPNKILVFIEDLKRLDNDDVRNSEYIEEDVIKRYSYDQASYIFRNSNIVASSAAQEDLLYKVKNGARGESLNDKLRSTTLNKSHDPLDDSRRISTADRLADDLSKPLTKQ